MTATRLGCQASAGCHDGARGQPLCLPSWPDMLAPKVKMRPLEPMTAVWYRPHAALLEKTLSEQILHQRRRYDYLWPRHEIRSLLPNRSTSSSPEKLGTPKGLSNKMPGNTGLGILKGIVGGSSWWMDDAIVNKLGRGYVYFFMFIVPGHDCYWWPRREIRFRYESGWCILKDISGALTTQTPGPQQTIQTIQRGP